MRLLKLTVCLCGLWASGLYAAAHHRTALPYQHWQTKQGTPVYFIETHQLPTLDVSVVFDAGSARDGRAYGVAALTNSLMDAGSDGLAGNEIQQRFDQVGALFDSHVGRDMATLSLKTLVDKTYREPAVATFLSLLKSPLFPKGEVKRVKHQFQNSLQALQQSPRALAQMHFYQELYGDQPYGHLVIGDKASVAALTRSAVVAFYQRYYVAQNAAIVIVGSVSQQHAKVLAENIAGSLPQGNHPRPITPMVAYHGVHKWVEYPSNQTSVLWGQQGINRQDPNYFALMVGNSILGEGMTSRLFKRVRSEGGYVYTVQSRFNRLLQPGPFVVSFQTRTLAAVKAYDLVKSVTKKFIEEGPSEAELKAAKKSIIGRFALSLASNEALKNALIVQAFYHVPADYYETYRAKVAAVTVADVREAMRQHFDYHNFVAVLVGKPIKVHRDG